MPISRLSTTSASTTSRASISATSTSQLLRQGAKGAAVSDLQRALAQAGFNPGGIDGDFGPKTRAAVVAFQRANGLGVDGVVGPQTWGALSGNSFTPGPSTTTPTQPPASGSTSGWRAAVLEEARKHIGFQERGTNGNPFSTYFGRPAEAWCADFVSYLYTNAGRPLNQPWTPALTQTLRNNGSFNRWNPQPGDIVMFDWNPGTGTDHTGVVERVYSSNGRMYVQTIEGNSGDQVRRRTYPLDSSQIQGFGHV